MVLLSRAKRITAGKIALCAFQNRVCPRFDQTRDILLLDGRSPEKKPMEKIQLSGGSPEEKLNILTQREVKTIIVGGMQEKFQEMFLQHRIQVIWGVMGEIKDVIRAYAKGLLYPGVGPILKTPHGKAIDRRPDR